jgi:hypothetical protein
MDKKRALKLFKTRYYDYHDILEEDLKHLKQCYQYLCLNMPEKLQFKWNVYWTKINKERKNSMGDYYWVGCGEELYLLRLLTAIWFIEDTYNNN